MALALARNAIARQGSLKTLLGKQVAVSSPIQIQVAKLQALHGEKYPYLKPWPYETKNFNVFHEFFDYSVDRLNEQSKVIVVDGNIGSGKNEFAKRLAWNFDMKYIPDVVEDDLFIMDNGFDIRSVDHMLPDTAKNYTLQRFLKDPHPESGAPGNLQYLYYVFRYLRYARALLHLVSTGQGVVVVRSPYSDRVLAEAKRKMGWLTKNFMKYYDDVASNSHCMLWKPHVHIYLDAPVNVCMDNIKKRARENEKGARNLTDTYLNMIETVYKTSYLPKQRISGEVVEIDWREVGSDMDMEVIAEEIAELDLEIHDNDDPKFDDWKNLTEDKVGFMRKYLADEQELRNWVNQDVPFNCPEITLSDDDNDIRRKVLYEHPAIKRPVGWAPELGDRTTLKLF
jgi:NADH dehydrogenase (ubiquinone) 1 alpha subcomplex subunit 10